MFTPFSKNRCKTTRADRLVGKFWFIAVFCWFIAMEDTHLLRYILCFVTISQAVFSRQKCSILLCIKCCCCIVIVLFYCHCMIIVLPVHCIVLYFFLWIHLPHPCLNLHLIQEYNFVFSLFNLLLIWKLLMIPSSFLASECCI